MLRTAKYLYIIGGCAQAAEREPIGQIERIHIEKTLSTVRIISENCGQSALPRRSPACFLVENRKIIVAGGCLGPNEHSDSIEVLQIEKDNMTTVLIDGKKLEIGASCSGFDVESKSHFKPIVGGFQAHSCLDDVQILDADLECRTIDKTNKNLPKIKNCTIVDVGNNEYLMFGGWEDEQKTSRAIRSLKFNDDFTDFKSDFAGFLPYPVEGHSSVRFGSKLLLIGGFDGFSVIDSIVCYDLETRQSEIIDVKLFEKRENHVSAVLSDEFLVVAGGWNSRRALDEVEVFKIKENNGKIELERCEVDGKLMLARNRPTGIAV